MSMEEKPRKAKQRPSNLYIKRDGPAQSLSICGKRSICCIHGWCQFDQLFQDVCEAGPHDWILKPALKHEICKILRAPLWKILQARPEIVPNCILDLYFTEMRKRRLLTYGLVEHKPK